MIKAVLFALCACATAGSALAEVNTNRTIDWASISTGSLDVATSPKVDFLGFRIGMNVEEAIERVRSDQRFSGGTFGFGDPILTYDAAMDRERIIVSFPPFDHVMKVDVSTAGTTEDSIYLFFLPDPQNRVVYGMNRRVSADDRTIGREEFWDQVFAKFGTVPLNRINGYGRSGNTNQADYSWNAENQASQNKACKWGKPIFGGNGDVMFSIDPYSLRHLEGTSNWLRQGCATILTVGEGGHSDTPALSSFSMLAFDVELYVGSLEQNTAAKDFEIQKVETELKAFKSSLGGSAPDL